MLKNMFDFCVFRKTLKDLEIQIEKLAKLCRRINLKLAPSKFSLSTAVKFGGTIISAEKIEENSVIFLDPPDNRIREGKYAGSGSLNVTGYGQSYGTLHRANIGSGRSSGSLGLGSIQNMTQGSGTRGSGGPMRMRQSEGVSGARSKQAVEVINVTDSEDDEELDEMEARLMRMVA